ncbi:integrase [Spinactinospora alkalitolerans]|uniref:Integrase n=1 Tax=Spinactinospora alkalitolerans TaxID=687207 RepID=A0A852U4Y3_9ACTN|nr:site-specific integrase [Spinactinospora alkalitolerans]NYE49000.1 integrase [Spinactinospora alkalitolerans]
MFAYKVPYRDGNGTQTSETWSTLTKARKFRDLVRSQKHAGLLEDFKAGQQSVSAWAAGWLETAGAIKREATHVAYETLLRLYILPELGGMAVRAVTAMDVQRAVNAWAKTRSPRSVHLTYTVCASMFKAAVVAGLRRVSPCVGIELPELPDTEVEPFTVAQVWALAGAIRPQYRLLVLMAAQTGLRIGELRGLTWDRIDLHARTVTVDRQVRDGQFRPVKSKASRRVVPLSDALVVELGAYRLAHPPKRLTVGVKGSHAVTVEPVFTSPRGRLLADSTVTPYWKAACEVVGIDATARKFHRLRHTFASVLIDRNESPKKIQRWMGHSSIAVTMDVYGHLYPTSDDSLRSAMDDAFALGPAPLATVPDPSDPLR